MANNKQREDKMPRMFSTLKEAHDIINDLEAEIIKWQNVAFDRADKINHLNTMCAEWKLRAEDAANILAAEYAAHTRSNKKWKSTIVKAIAECDAQCVQSSAEETK